MNKEIFPTLVEQSNKILAPVQELNRSVVDNTEKLVALQISSVQSYYALGFSLLRAALEVKDAETLQAYIAKQNELIKSASEKFVGDAKAVAELGRDFSAKTQELSQESVKAITPKAA
jgi:phasin family protein